MSGPDRSDTDSCRRTVEVVLVTAPRCHLCDDAKEVLGELARRYPLTLREVALSSEEGVAVARRFRVPFPPVLLVDGTYAGHGRVSRRKLGRILEQAIRSGTAQ